LQRRWNLLSVLHPFEKKRPCDVPSPAQMKHRRDQQRLFQKRPRVVRPHHWEQRFNRETVLRTQRQQKAIIISTGLQFEVERPAKTFAERQSPSSVDSSAERSMHDQLHTAGFIKEPFKDNSGLCGKQSDGSPLG